MKLIWHAPAPRRSLRWCSNVRWGTILRWPSRITTSHWLEEPRVCFLRAMSWVRRSASSNRITMDRLSGFHQSLTRRRADLEQIKTQRRFRLAEARSRWLTKLRVQDHPPLKCTTDRQTHSWELPIRLALQTSSMPTRPFKNSKGNPSNRWTRPTANLRWVRLASHPRSAAVVFPHRSSNTNFSCLKSCSSNRKR